MPLFLAALLAAAPAASDPSWPADIDLSSGVDIDEGYRAQFELCDTRGLFRGHSSAHGFGCKGDPNKATVLRRMPDGAVAYTAKLAVDLDGSPFACSSDHGPTDQCPTTIMLPAPNGAGEVPVDSDAVPYVVIPAAGPDDVRGEFTRLTGVRAGDFGVVVYHGHVVPVIVADTGPFPKIGEGSMALHRALGRELCRRRVASVCTAVVDPMESIEGDVTTILFPGTARDDLTPANVAAITRSEGMRLWAASPVSRMVRAAPGAVAGG